MNFKAPKQKVITDGKNEGASTGQMVYSKKPVSISTVATFLGYRLTSSDTARVGMEVKKSYVNSLAKLRPNATSSVMHVRSRTTKKQLLLKSFAPFPSSVPLCRVSADSMPPCQTQLFSRGCRHDPLRESSLQELGSWSTFTHA